MDVACGRDFLVISAKLTTCHAHLVSIVLLYDETEDHYLQRLGTMYRHRNNVPGSLQRKRAIVGGG